MKETPRTAPSTKGGAETAAALDFELRLWLSAEIVIISEDKAAEFREQKEVKEAVSPPGRSSSFWIDEL